MITITEGNHSFLSLGVYADNDFNRAAQRILEALKEFEYKNPDKRVISWKPNLDILRDCDTNFILCGLWIDHEPKKTEEKPVMANDLGNALGQD